MGNWAEMFGLRTATALASAWRSRGRALVADFLGEGSAVEPYQVHGLPERLGVAAAVLAWVPLGKSVLSEIIVALFEAHKMDAVERLVAQALESLGPHDRHTFGRRVLFRSTLVALAPLSLSRALAFGEANFAGAQGPDTALALAKLQVRAGALRRPLELLAPYPRASPDLVRLLREQQSHLERGMEETAPGVAPGVVPANGRRSLYYASQTLPHHSSGYAIRTHYLLGSLRAAGWDVACFARFGYPNDRWDFRARPKVGPRAEVDGVSYAFRPDRGGFRTLHPEAYQRAAVDALMEQAVDFRPAILHCASNYLVGQAGTEAARRLGLPSIYEVRGLWHLTRASKLPPYEGSEHYRMSEVLEVQAARRADHVLAITAGVRDLLIAGGVEAQRVTLLPNAVDPDLFVPRERDPDLAAAVGLRDEVVIGFVGSFAPYEGLASLLDATVRLRDELGDRFRVLLVGDGAVNAALRARARALGLDSLVTFTGRVPHAEVSRYYSLIDIAVYPRAGHPVCELVSPLKPLEAMSMAKAVVLSDVGGQADMVTHERTGLVHRTDDVGSLTQQLSRLVRSAALREELGGAARRWVRLHRSWSSNADTVAGVYRKLLGAN